jgi:hypothetical protein
MDTIRLWLVTFGVTAVLLFFFSFPLIFILYGGAGGVIGGAILLAPLIAVQYLVLVLFRRLFRRDSHSDKQDGRDGNGVHGKSWNHGGHDEPRDELDSR